MRGRLKDAKVQKVLRHSGLRPGIALPPRSTIMRFCIAWKTWFQLTLQSVFLRFQNDRHAYLLRHSEGEARKNPAFWKVKSDETYYYWTIHPSLLTPSHITYTKSTNSHRKKFLVYNNTCNIAKVKLWIFVKFYPKKCQFFGMLNRLYMYKNENVLC